MQREKKEKSFQFFASKLNSFNSHFANYKNVLIANNCAISSMRSISGLLSTGSHRTCKAALVNSQPLQCNELVCACRCTSKRNSVNTQ